MGALHPYFQYMFLSLEKLVLYWILGGAEISSSIYTNMLLSVLFEDTSVFGGLF